MSLVIQIFGKDGCQLCEQTERKIEHFLKKWKLDGDVEVLTWDISTVDGDAEASLYDVMEIPTTIIEYNEQELRRWSGPSADMHSDEVHKVLVDARA